MTSTPHDTFFRAIFGEPRHAAAELRAVLDRRLLDFQFVLDDLAVVSDQQLFARGMRAIARLALLAMQGARVRPRLGEYMAAAIRALRHDLRGPGTVRAMAQLVCYVFEVTEEPEARVRALLSAALQPSQRSAVMTAADQLRAKAEIKGRIEGRTEERRASLVELLESRFGRLDGKARKRIQAAPLDQLVTWMRHGFMAANLADVFAR